MLDAINSSITLNTLAVENISIQPETNTHVGIVTQVENSTTRDIEITIDFVAVVEQNSYATANNISINISTGRVETNSGKVEHSG